MVLFRWGVEVELPGGPFAHGVLANLILGLVSAGIAVENLYLPRLLRVNNLLGNDS